VARPGVPGGLEAGAGGWGWDPWSDSGGYPEGDWGGYDQPWPTCDDSGYGDPWESGWSWPGECWSDDGSGWDPGGWGRG
jgi:hypothetical protein